MNNDEFYTYEDRAYIKPTLSSGEQEKFIDNLRDIQKQNTAQIAEQTYNLGTQVPSNLGGLGGGESYFTSRYQTPQTNEMVETLKTAAQAQALNDILSNYQAQLKNKYSQAQRAYNKRQRALANSLLGGNQQKKGGIDVDTGDTPLALEGLSYRKWVNDNGYDQFVSPTTVVRSGVPVEAIVAANEAWKKRLAENANKSSKQSSAFQPFYSGQLVL